MAFRWLLFDLSSQELCIRVIVPKTEKQRYDNEQDIQLVLITDFRQEKYLLDLYSSVVQFEHQQML